MPFLICECKGNDYFSSAKLFPLFFLHFFRSPPVDAPSPPRRATGGGRRFAGSRAPSHGLRFPSPAGSLTAGVRRLHGGYKRKAAADVLRQLRHRLSVLFFFVSLSVEPEGIEPSSKQTESKLSTCFSPPSVFVRRQDRSHQPTPYPLKLHRRHGAAVNYPRFCCTTLSRCLGATVLG